MYCGSIASGARLKFLFLKHGWTAESFLEELQHRMGFVFTASRSSRGWSSQVGSSRARASERRYSGSGPVEGRDYERPHEEDDADWGKFVGNGATLVIYMPGQNYTDIASKLTSSGLSGDTPCAVISRATIRHQRTYRTKVRDLYRTPQLASPTLLIVGEVVGLDAHLDDSSRDSAAVAQVVLPDSSGNSIPFPETFSETFLTGASPGSR
jgi:hypothetical protein